MWCSTGSLVWMSARPAWWCGYASRALAAPLAPADCVVANGRAAAEPTARRHTSGIRASSCWSAVSSRARGSMLPSPRWPPMAEGHDVHLSVCGLHLPGREWYEQDLRNRAGRADVAGRWSCSATSTQPGICSTPPTSCPCPRAPSRSAAPRSGAFPPGVPSAPPVSRGYPSPDRPPRRPPGPCRRHRRTRRRGGAPARRPGPALEALRAGARRCGAALQHRPLRRRAATRARWCCASRPRRRFTHEVDRTMRRFGYSSPGAPALIGCPYPPRGPGRTVALD